MFAVFVRNWWRKNDAWPGGREPDPTAPKHYLARNIASEEEARSMCKEYNATHDPGPLSRKAEYTEQ
jgi:hypothetical protein